MFSNALTEGFNFFFSKCVERTSLGLLACGYTCSEAAMCCLRLLHMGCCYPPSLLSVWIYR